MVIGTRTIRFLSVTSGPSAVNPSACSRQSPLKSLEQLAVVCVRADPEAESSHVLSPSKERKCSPLFIRDKTRPMIRLWPKGQSSTPLAEGVCRTPRIGASSRCHPQMKFNLFEVATNFPMVIISAD
jgi:hypothetical protein